MVHAPAAGLAAQITTSLPEQRYLTHRAALLRAVPPSTDPAVR
jgi:hypothetical protein